jgi:hypothetical protein
MTQKNGVHDEVIGPLSLRKSPLVPCHQPLLPYPSRARTSR